MWKKTFKSMEKSHIKPLSYGLLWIGSVNDAKQRNGDGVVCSGNYQSFSRCPGVPPQAYTHTHTPQASAAAMKKNIK